MTVLKISAKEFQPHVNYQWKQITKELDQTDFMIRNILKEVEDANTKKRKEMKRVLKAIRISGVSILIMMLQTQMAFAETIGTGAEIITPSEATKFGLQLALIAVGASFGIAAIALVGAGVARMFRQKKMARDWTTDILKGLAQVVVAIPTVYLIFYLSLNLFGNLEDFVVTFFKN